jgi:hypothetical protein
MSASKKNDGLLDDSRRPSLWLVSREKTDRPPVEAVERQSRGKAVKRSQGPNNDDDPGPSAA